MSWSDSLDALHEVVTKLGFAPADRADLGDRLDHVLYLRRVYQGQHQYLSLVAHEGQLLEVVFEVYYTLKARTTKRLPPKEAQKRGFAPLYANLYRTITELEEACARVVPLPL